ncbi:MAG: hypothetical protein JXB32_18275 [Deltaproteobacteria bacterium]|nr:hypothetical protein [Deltaproteobacteria bacterium]
MKPPQPMRAMLPSLVLERRLRRIPPSAVQRLAALAERQSEGRLDRSTSSTTYFGSTYFTFPLERVRSAFAGRAVRQMGSAELARTLEAHPLLRLRLMRLAREEAERRLGEPGSGHGRAREDAGCVRGYDVVPGTARVTSTISQDGGAVVIEVGLELPCVVGERGGRGGAARGAGREARP